MLANLRRVVGLCCAILLVGACGGVQDFPVANPNQPGYILESELKEEDTVFGGGIDLFDLGKSKSQGGGGSGIGVNSYLWRASLDTVSFMPLSSADPFGGVIITDWYTPPEATAERFKLIVYILDRQLRSDGIRVSVFRQTQSAKGWADANVTKKTAINFENEILDHARQLRFAARDDSN